MAAALRTVLLAAGASRRMEGRDKLLEPVEGLTLLRRQTLAALNADVGPVSVTLPPGWPERAAALRGLDVQLLLVPDAVSGMSASIRAAAMWAKDDALMICPADMPEITAQDFQTMAEAFHGTCGDTPLRAVDAAGQYGHPVIFPARLVPFLTRLSGDEGARSILRDHPPCPVALPDYHATIDLDTQQQWAAWRAKHPSL